MNLKIKRFKLNSMGHIKTNIIIIGALGLIKKDTDKHIDKIAGDPYLPENF